MSSKTGVRVRTIGGKMSRPRNPVGTHGVVNAREVESGKWRARTLYRFEDGRRRQVERFAASESRARHALKVALTTIETPSHLAITKRTKLADLAEAYLQLKAETGRAPRTLSTYRHNADTIIKPRIGQLTVGEATTMRLQTFITDVGIKHGHGSAKGCRSVLSGMLALAVRSDALTTNPVVGIAGIERKTSRAASALPVEHVPAFLTTIHEDAELQRLDLVELWEFMARTGCRIGEGLALRWDRVDFTGGTVTLGSSVSRVPGRGLMIQEAGKTATSERTIVVPSDAVAMLRARWESQPPNYLNLVFPSMLGKLRDTSNTESDWRANRERLGYPSFTSHGFRKTVATALDAAGLSARDIAEYLGHKNPSMTQDVYMARNTQSVKAAAALSAMFGVSSGSRTD
ncbi:site-specific integrase [Cryobacterium sp. TMT2-17-1]|uniref:site-specific integrase n=1 Tax=Cryobacterium sp. TMT2-17-1 TaxID=1259248 RepID=UPI00106BA9A4|nr:site-specific integrase [Cryobacterium sp. TMT2-17-1]TFC55365.1 site-specific integrase [Cryobacterium sp. TMT2-17-1]